VLPCGKGITSLIGVVMAYVQMGEAPEWARTHYRLQVRTFWIGLLYGVVAAATLVLLVGWLVLLFALIWLIVRCVKGLGFASRNEAYPSPGTWLW
jgi:uncharacterized membrane protein